MGLTDVLFGRKKLPKAQQEKLFAISTARITLETELGLKPTGDAAVVFKPLSAAEFVRAGYRAVLFDMPGHGGSTPTQTNLFVYLKTIKENYAWGTR